MALCPILQDEVLKIVNDQKSIGVRFHNGSNIFCTVVGEQARGYRLNEVVYNGNVIKYKMVNLQV